MPLSRWMWASWLFCGLAMAADPPLPYAAEVLSLGAATCAGSTCHGATSPREGGAVLQSEFFTWKRHDAHSGAYAVLQGERGRAIAAKLGLPSATEADQCLGCHTHFVPAERRGKRYRLEDGVSCEACHGGAQNWLGIHISGARHAENLAAGLFPTEDPAQRARLCLACHHGSAARPIDHQLMAAGHPPLVFELDTYTAIQPPHYQLDADYRARKTPASGLQTWFVGQLRAAQAQLEFLSGERWRMQGVQPELIAFDCHACHHSLDKPRWEAGVGGPLPPGRLRLHDAHLVMVSLGLAVLVPERAAAWDKAVADLQRATLSSAAAVRMQAETMQRPLIEVLASAASLDYSKAALWRLAQQLADRAQSGDGADFSAAEQMALALGALSADLRLRGESLPPEVDPALDALLDAVGNRIAFEAAGFRQAVARLTQLLRAGE